MRRRTLALLAAGLAAAVPAVTAAALLWTLVATPLTTTVNQSTTFNLTATNLDPLTELGCLEVDLPASFVIESLGAPVASNGREWSSSQSGNAVIVRSLSGGGRLKLGASVQFTISAHGTAAGIFLWPNHAHRQQDCSSADQPGVSLTVTVLPALVATPTPTPSPAATATPGPLPTATPKATPRPTATPPPPSSVAPSPATPTPSATPAATEVATATGEPTDSPRESQGSGAAVASQPPDGPTSRATLQLLTGRGEGATAAEADVGLELFGLLDADYVWFVPAASVGIPGLLVIAWVLLQGFGALAWIPFVRRMGEERDPHEHHRLPIGSR